ncbi:MAG TPA: Gfo/Idh/MocA family oxidoreductase [Planctomycetaceae bacterium]|nr:Gfo/Idh/MocA family oxidoreductase [Planctomycetaceae bacterium]
MSDKPTASPTSRREFLKTTTTAALAGGVLANLNQVARGAYASGNEEIKVGLIGCGGRGSQAANQALSTEGPVKLVAMADAFEDHVQTAARRIEAELGERAKERFDVPPERRFAGFDAYQKVIDGGVDLVILATPPGFRPIHFEAAIKAGKHVFMEKPVAVDAPGVRQVLEAVKAANQKNLKVGVGLQRHHQRPYLETIQRIKDGAIGDVIALRVYWNGGGVWDPRKSRDEVKSEMEYQMRNWYYYNWLSGDHIVEQHIHNIDVGCWIKDAYPVLARGMGGREVRTEPHYGEIFDHHAVQFEFADGTYMFSECRHIRNCWNSVDEHAHGSKGTANVSGASYSTSDGEKWRYRGPNPNPYQVEHDDLFAAIRNDRTYNEGEFGAYSTMAAILGRMCTYSGKEIRWDEALASEKSIMPGKFAWDADPPTRPDSEGRYPIPVPGVTEVV